MEQQAECSAYNDSSDKERWFETEAVGEKS